MKQVMQRVAIICALSCWILIGVSAKHNQHLVCRQEWKAGFVNAAIGDEKEMAIQVECGCSNTEACSKAETLLPGRAVQFLLQ
jgi:hypothetical protein